MYASYVIVQQKHFIQETDQTDTEKKKEVLHGGTRDPLDEGTDSTPDECI